MKPTRSGIVCALVGVGSCILLWALLPSGVVVLNDDFGYLRSVLETAARGRPWTDDWLEPWAASLSIISALIFKASGSFRLATQGLQCVLWGVFVAAVFRLLHRRQSSCWNAVLLSFAICYAATLFWKGIEFTGLVLYLPCLAIATGATLRNQWGLFAVVACVALASRQSALVWFVIPAVGCVEACLSRSPGKFRRGAAPLMACIAGAATFLICRFGMNESHAQRVAAVQAWESVQWTTAAGSLKFALLLGLICLGAANALKWSAGGGDNNPKGSTKAAFILCRLVPISVLVILLCLKAYADVQQEHEFYRSPAALFNFASWIAIACFGWLIAPVVPNKRLFIAALAAVLLVCLRSVTWDYYWIDAAFFAFFSAFSPETEKIDSTGDSLPSRNRKLRGFAALAAITVMLVSSIAWIDRAKRMLDDCRAKEVLLEQSLRAGEISPEDISVSPFGFIAWHLYPYFTTIEAASPGYIANFRDHLRPPNLAWETRSANDHSPIANASSVIRSGVFPTGWRGERNQYILRRIAEPAPAMLPIVSAHYRFEPFPLTDTEWRSWSRVQQGSTSTQEK